jgi:hypothetical protein
MPSENDRNLSNAFIKLRNNLGRENDGLMYLIMITAYCLTLAGVAFIYRYITKRRETRKRSEQHAA